MNYASINPSDGRTLQDFATHGDGEIEIIVELAHTAYVEHWSTRRVGEREAVVKRLAALLRDRREQMARLVTLEMAS